VERCNSGISRILFDHRLCRRYYGAMVNCKNILVVAVAEDTYGKIASVLTRNDFAVDRIPTPAAALELVTLVCFKAIIVNHPLRAMRLDDFLAEVKGTGSASREALVAIFVSSKKQTDDLAITPDGVDVVIGPFGGQSERDRQLCKLLGIVPRAAVRVKVNTEVTLVDQQNNSFVSQTKDLSTSGFFAITDRLAPVGSHTRAIFSFPGDKSPFVAEAEVVRHAVGSTDEPQGMGLRFMSFQDGHINRLSRVLESLYA
jgi:PilZ domain